jgi:hypothetical protein
MAESSLVCPLPAYFQLGLSHAFCWLVGQGNRILHARALLVRNIYWPNARPSQIFPVGLHRFYMLPRVAIAGYKESWCYAMTA